LKNEWKTLVFARVEELGTVDVHTRSEFSNELQGTVDKFVSKFKLDEKEKIEVRVREADESARDMKEFTHLLDFNVKIWKRHVEDQFDIVERDVAVKDALFRALIKTNDDKFREHLAAEIQLARDAPVPVDFFQKLCEAHHKKRDELVKSHFDIDKDDLIRKCLVELGDHWCNDCYGVGEMSKAYFAICKPRCDCRK
jgi:hypothetical protein